MTCGLPIGDVAVIFRARRYKRARAALKDRDVVSTQAVVDAGLQLDMEKDLDELGITEDHCRRALISAMDMRDYY
jgi:DNA-directed RNA polymerase subunit N (RpoN/RPB10)